MIDFSAGWVANPDSTTYTYPTSGLDCNAGYFCPSGSIAADSTSDPHDYDFGDTKVGKCPPGFYCP